MPDILYRASARLRKVRDAFTLVELLLSIAIVAVLASIIIVAINPQKQIKDARNAQRRSDVNTILNAVYQYMLDNEGQPPTDITAVATEICKTGSASCVNGVNLNTLTGAYLTAIPSDPVADVTGTGTDYFIYQDEFGRITITAPNAELGIAISR